MKFEFTDAAGFDSSVIRNAFYNSDSEELAIEFVHGNVRVYDEVDKGTYIDLAEVERLGGSAGRFYNEEIKGVYNSSAWEDTFEPVQADAADGWSFSENSNTGIYFSPGHLHYSAAHDPGKAIDITPESATFSDVFGGLGTIKTDDGLSRFRVKYTTEHEVEIRGEDAQAVKEAIENSYDGTVTEVTWLL